MTLKLTLSAFFCSLSCNWVYFVFLAERGALLKGLMKGKKVVVMGVSNSDSIAWSIAKSFYHAGAELFFTSENEQIGKTVSQLIDREMPNSFCTVCDVNNDKDVYDAFAKINDQWGKIDGLVHSIARTKSEGLPYSYLQTTRDQFLSAHEVHTYSLVLATQEVKRYMVDGGTIVTLTHMGSEKVLPNYPIFGVAKSALESSVRYLAYELGPADIRVNAISAGPIRTSSTQHGQDFDYMLSIVEERAPLRRGIDAEEVGDVALFLCSYLGRGITGEVLHVDGGYNIIGM
jgi:enoyl-[acyl-carrier protein] reductase I